MSLACQTPSWSPPLAAACFGRDGGIRVLQAAPCAPGLLARLSVAPGSLARLRRAKNRCFVCVLETMWSLLQRVVVLRTCKDWGRLRCECCYPKGGRGSSATATVACPTRHPTLGPGHLRIWRAGTLVSHSPLDCEEWLPYLFGHGKEIHSKAEADVPLLDCVTHLAAYSYIAAF